MGRRTASSDVSNVSVSPVILKCGLCTELREGVRQQAFVVVILSVVTSFALNLKLRR